MNFPTCTKCKKTIVMPPTKICTRCQSSASYADKVRKQDANQQKLVSVLFRITYKDGQTVERPFFGETEPSAIAVAHRHMIKNKFIFYHGKYYRNKDRAEMVKE